MNIKKLIISFVFFLGVQYSYAQTDKFLVELGIEMFEFGDYEDALEVFEQAIEHNENNVKAHFYVGKCYLQTTDRKGESVDYLKKSYELDPEVSNMIFFLIGEGYRYHYQFDEAINFYILFKEELETNRRLFLNDDVDALKKKTERKIEECINAKKFIAAPQKVEIKQLEGGVNSEYEEYAPTLSVDGNTLIFTSRRKGSTGSLKDVDNKYYEDIWVSHKNGDVWSEPVGVSDVINTDHHESNTVISPDNNELYIYRSDNLGDIYVSTKKKGEWGKPKEFKLVNTEEKESSVFISSDGQHLFYASGKEGGVGGVDIYHATKQGSKWSSPVNLGEIVNTEYDEDGPSFDVNTSTLYFSSKGHNSMGGFDIYFSEYDEDSGEWSEPENLGYPVNSPEDDLHFVISSDGEKAYYATTRKDSYGEHDIYLVSPPHELHTDSVPTSDTLASRDPEEQDTTLVDDTPLIDSATIEEKGDKSYFVEILVKNEEGEEIPALAKVTDLSNNSLYNEQYFTGTYKTEFRNEEAKTYVLTIEAEGYLYQTVRLEVPSMGTEEFTLNKTIVLKKPKLKKVNVLRNVYFEFDNYTINHKSIQELKLLHKYLEENPNAIIELAGHTCFIGPPSYNNELSYKRALAVKNYLIKKGIAQSRIVAKGYGESKPLATNDDEEEGRELNRRTEFIILSK